MQSDVVYEILLNLSIYDIKKLYIINQSFNKVLVSSYFWEHYFNQHDLTFPNEKYQTVKEWVDLYILLSAQKIVDAMNLYDVISKTVTDPLIIKKIEDISLFKFSDLTTSTVSITKFKDKYVLALRTGAFINKDQAIQIVNLFLQQNNELQVTNLMS